MSNIAHHSKQPLDSKNTLTFAKYCSATSYARASNSSIARFFWHKYCRRGLSAASPCRAKSPVPIRPASVEHAQIQHTNTRALHMDSNMRPYLNERQVDLSCVLDLDTTHREEEKCTLSETTSRKYRCASHQVAHSAVATHLLLLLEAQRLLVERRVLRVLGLLRRAPERPRAAHVALARVQRRPRRRHLLRFARALLSFWLTRNQFRNFPFGTHISAQYGVLFLSNHRRDMRQKVELHSRAKNENAARHAPQQRQPNM